MQRFEKDGPQCLKTQKSLIMVYSFTSIVLEVFETMAHYFVNLCSTNQFLEML